MFSYLIRPRGGSLNTSSFYQFHGEADSRTLRRTGTKKGSQGKGRARQVSSLQARPGLNRGCPGIYLRRQSEGMQPSSKSRRRSGVREGRERLTPRVSNWKRADNSGVRAPQTARGTSILRGKEEEKFADVKFLGLEMGNSTGERKSSDPES